MCNLLIPLCPFVLHSVTTSDNNIKLHSSSDAKILFSYLSKRPYDNHSNPSSHLPSQKPPKPLAHKTTKLYKRTNWHTCACFFRRVGVLHPMPGPSRPTFGMSHKYCSRCSNAAKTLKPMRMGGLGDKTDPYWNRCIFAGARGVFENGFGDDFDVSGGNMNVTAPAPTSHERYSSPIPAQPQTSHLCSYDDVGRFIEGSSQVDGNEARNRGRRNWQQDQHDQILPQEARQGYDDRRKQNLSYPRTSVATSYGEDLDRYLASTYGTRDREKARIR